MMSVAKGVTAIAFNMAVDRGLIDIDKPVAHYWPEFAQGGQAGHPGPLDPRSHRRHPRPDDRHHVPRRLLRFPAYIRALEVQEPLWEPGTRAAYHVHNQGFLEGELLRRVTGMTVGPFLRANVTGPLKAEYAIGGMSDEEAQPRRRGDPQHPRRGCSPPRTRWVPDKPTTPEGWQDGAVLRSFAFLQNPSEPWHTTMNSPEWAPVRDRQRLRHGNARGVARIYGAVVGEVDGISLMSKGRLEAMITEQHNQTELLQERPYHQALGVLLNTPVAVYMGPNMRSFGHHGLGGSIGFGDPDARIGFSYCCNQMHAVGDNGPRARRLIDALYEVVG